MEVVADGGEVGEQNKSLAIDPITPTTLYAGDFKLPNSGGVTSIIKSVDGGTTWSHLPSGFDILAYALAIDSVTSGTLYAAGTGTPNLAKSKNGGGTWTSVSPTAGFVYALAWRMLTSKADAEDVFQETFLRAWTHLPSFRSGGNFTHWLKRIATNLCIDRLKARRRRGSSLEVAWLPEPPHEEPTRHEELVGQLLAELPAKHRAAVVLFYLEEKSVEEVARTLKQRPGTVKVWLFRAREKMKAVVEAREK